MSDDLDEAERKLPFPYLDWAVFVEGIDIAAKDGRPLETRGLFYIGIHPPETGSEAVRSIDDEGAASAVQSTATEAGPPDLASRYGSAGRLYIPIPVDAKNVDDVPGDSWMPPRCYLEAIDTVPQDAVIVGVIDRGIPLGHHRLRLAGGKRTRLLAAWQQTAAHTSKRPTEPDEQQPYLPFGYELYATRSDDGPTAIPRPFDLNALLAAHATGDGRGFAEIDFNRATRTVDFSSVLGARQLAGRFAHGAHVLDAAAGHDPWRSKSEKLDRLRVIAVTLPDRRTVGLSGTFLEFFALYAIFRIAHLADAIFEVQHGNDPGGRKSFPIIINMSFGKQAGPKDGSDFFHRTVNDLNKKRGAEKKPPVVLVIPVGNDNLERGHASLDVPGPGGSFAEITWRIRPEDQSSSFVELRAPLPRGFDVNKPLPVELAITAPGRRTATPSFHAFRVGDVKQLGDFLRVYCDVEDGSNDDRRMVFVVCAAPSLRQVNDPVLRRITTPAGGWHLALRHTLQNGDTIRVTLDVQTDQSVQPSAATGLRSFLETPGLETPGFRRFEPSGRVRDTFAYGAHDPDTGRPAGAQPRNLDTTTVMRHGTINATATGSVSWIVPVAGYRRSDGRPSPFSATGLRSQPTGGAHAQPLCAFPAEDDAAQFGLLASGATDGSAAAALGTSFSAALCTRWLADRALTMKAFNPIELLTELKMTASNAGSSPAWQPGPTAKIGAGRIEAELDRLGPRSGPSAKRRSAGPGRMGRQRLYQAVGPWHELSRFLRRLFRKS